ncbi:MAG: hypothetical protein OHK0023_03770 [Anaerolineae bacterium]
MSAEFVREQDARTDQRAESLAGLADQASPFAVSEPPSLAKAMPADSAAPGANPPNRRRRGWAILLMLVVASVIFILGAVFGYTQGPAIATLVASGRTFAEIGTEFQACFVAASQDEGIRGLFQLFGRNRPTATPGPRPTTDPTLARVVRGTVATLSETAITVDLAEGGQETLGLFPLAQIVTPQGNRLSRQGVLAGDPVNVLAFRSNALGGFGGARQAGPADSYTALCVMVDVSPK